ncbi:MAG: hypothetical protein ACE5HX_09880, partial [bacterium]
MRNKLYLQIMLLTIAFYNPINSSLFGQSHSKKQSMLTLGQLSRDFEELSARETPAIVQILATGYVPNTGTGHSSASLLSKQSSSGSGVILDPHGYIVTNAHVVEGGRRIQVVLT